jgi:hypothetical protein
VQVVGPCSWCLLVLSLLLLLLCSCHCLTAFPSLLLLLRMLH